MKKNKMMRLASMLLVMVLLTTSVIGGTFAKYTTQDSAYDEARVAKWGVELAVVGNLYGEVYEADVIADNNETGEVHAFNEAKDVVAPGTKNDEGMTFSLQGTPEVSGTVTATLVYENIYLNKGEYGVMVKVPDGTVTAANFDEFEDLYIGGSGSYTKATDYSDTDYYYTLEDYVNLTANYYPVEYAMIGTGSVVTSYNNPYSDSALTIDTLKGLSEAIGTCFGTSETPTYSDGRTTVTYSGTTFNPNDDLQFNVKLGNQKIIWKWDFCQTGTGDDECKDGDSACDACKADTILGLLQGNENTPLNGAVVVKSGENYITPSAASGTASANNGHYNLESYFELDITVTQTD